AALKARLVSRAGAGGAWPWRGRSAHFRPDRRRHWNGPGGSTCRGTIRRQSVLRGRAGPLIGAKRRVGGRAKPLSAGASGLAESDPADDCGGGDRRAYRSSARRRKELPADRCDRREGISVRGGSNGRRLVRRRRAAAAAAASRGRADPAAANGNGGKFRVSSSAD